MTVGKAITHIREDKPNSIPESKLISWLEDLDRRVNIEIFEPLGHGVEQTEYNVETELLIPDAFRAIYEFWLRARIDYEYNEIGMYNNDIEFFREYWMSFQKWYGLKHPSNVKPVKITY